MGNRDKFKYLIGIPDESVVVGQDEQEAAAVHRADDAVSAKKESYRPAVKTTSYSSKTYHCDYAIN